MSYFVLRLQCVRPRPGGGDVVLGRARGFTLIELMITISVAAVLVSLAAPSFRELLLRNKAGGITNEFSAALSQARGLAIASNTCVTLCTATVSATNAPVCQAPNSAGYQSGWIVFANPTCDGAQVDPTAAGAVLRQSRNGSSDGFTINGSTAALNMLMFDPRGISTAASSGLFQIRAPDDSANVHARTICLDVAGRATIRKYTTTCS